MNFPDLDVVPHGNLSTMTAFPHTRGERIDMIADSLERAARQVARTRDNLPYFDPEVVAHMLVNGTDYFDATLPFEAEQALYPVLTPVDGCDHCGMSNEKHTPAWQRHISCGGFTPPCQETIDQRLAEGVEPERPEITEQAVMSLADDLVMASLYAEGCIESGDAPLLALVLLDTVWPARAVSAFMGTLAPVR